MYIFQSLGLSCVPYLPKVMPVLFHCMRTCEDGLREFMFQQLTLLIQFVRQHIRKYLLVRTPSSHQGAALPAARLLNRIGSNDFVLVLVAASNSTRTFFSLCISTGPLRPTFSCTS